MAPESHAEKSGSASATDADADANVLLHEFTCSSDVFLPLSTSSSSKWHSHRQRHPSTTLKCAKDIYLTNTSFSFPLPPICPSLISLAALLAAMVILLAPNALLPFQTSQQQGRNKQNHQDQFGAIVKIVEKTEEAQEEEFSCGGGPFSYFAASLVSIPCDRPRIHSCCEIHDLCYDQRHLSQSYCDDQFCACLDTIQSSTYCEWFTQPGLCLATRTFGHMFHWSGNCGDERQNSTDCLVPEKSEDFANEQQQQQEITDIGSEFLLLPTGKTANRTTGNDDP